MRAFITGSRAYGSPGPKSDIDLVVMVSNSTRDLLLRYGTKVEGEDQVIRFGKLNIIACLNEEEFAIWKVGTRMCFIEKDTSGNPTSRERAIEVFSQLFEEADVQRSGNSGGDKDAKTAGDSEEG